MTNTDAIAFEIADLALAAQEDEQEAYEAEVLAPARIQQEIEWSWQDWYEDDQCCCTLCG